MAKDTRSVTDGLPIVDELQQVSILQAADAMAPTIKKTAQQSKPMHPVLAWLNARFAKHVVKPAEYVSSDILDGFTAALNAIQNKKPAANSHHIEPTKVLRFTASPSTLTVINPELSPTALDPNASNTKPKNKN